MQINKYIAHAGVCSRRKADEFIKTGQIQVNGEIMTDVTYRVQKDDIIYFRNTELTPEKHVYILLNKPKGYITTAADEKDRKTVLDLVRFNKKIRLYPIGRLDRMTTGLLVLTNDGEFAQKLAHPRNKIVKQYKVTLDRPLEAPIYDRLKIGITLRDGFVKPDRIAFVEDSKRKELIIELHSGKNRVIRRIFEHVGYKIIALDRFNYAGLTKRGLVSGAWRELTPTEVKQL
jgi:23S rRNA pseudouridine2605 synthase